MQRRLPRGPRRVTSPGAIERTVALFAAIAHPARLTALLELAQGTRSVTELQAAIGLSQTATSHQLRVLREAHLVTTTRAGRRVLYALADHHVAHIVQDALIHASEP
jgi:DNA-binding transcriptional ArsR family regulator